MHVLSASPTSSVRLGARAALPVAVIVAIFGASFGVLARTAGFAPVAAVAMSATTFAGSAQFAAVSVLADGGSLAAAVTAALLLNARYGPLGIAVAPAISGSALRRLLAAQLVVDESWALATEPGGRTDFRRLAGAGLTIYVGWVLGTLAGALLGTAVADPAALGLDAAFPALFLGLLAPRLAAGTARWVALGGALIATALTPVLPPGLPIVLASVAAFTGVTRQ